jgi:hypothetical protein
MNYSPALMEKAKKTELLLVGQKVTRKNSSESHESSDLKNIDLKRVKKIGLSTKRNNESVNQFLNYPEIQDHTDNQREEARNTIDSPKAQQISIEDTDKIKKHTERSVEGRVTKNKPKLVRNNTPAEQSNTNESVFTHVKGQIEIVPHKAVKKSNYNQRMSELMTNKKQKELVKPPQLYNLDIQQKVNTPFFII